MKITKTFTEVVEHKTREDYLLVEENDTQRDELYLHGYDGEDAEIYDMIKELRFENPQSSYKLIRLRTVQV